MGERQKRAEPYRGSTVWIPLDSKARPVQHEAGYSERNSLLLQIAAGYDVATEAFYGSHAE